MNLSPTPNYVFIHIGNPLPVSLKLSINSVIKSSQQMAHIYLITDQNCIFPKFVNIVKVDLGKKQYIYEKLTKIYNSDVLRARGGYWYKSLLRYFFLYDWFLENQDIEHLIHVESDALVYIDNEMYELLVNRYNKISVAKNTSGKHVPTVILVPNRSSFDKAMSFIESDVFKNQQNTFFYTDQYALKRLEASNLLEELPSHPQDAIEIRGQQFIFDTAVVGSYLFGKDPAQNRFLQQSGFVYDIKALNQIQKQSWKANKGLVSFRFQNKEIYILTIHNYAKVRKNKLLNMESNYWKTTIDEANEYTSRKLSIRLDLFLYETKIRLLAFLKKKNKFMI